jgi:ATP-binding cassette subfamily F protein 3
MKLTIRPGERIGLLGRNCRQIDLIKLLPQASPPPACAAKARASRSATSPSTSRACAPTNRRQHMRLDPQTREQDLRNYLGGFDFRGGHHALRPFSGGEKRPPWPC